RAITSHALLLSSLLPRRRLSPLPYTTLFRSRDLRWSCKDRAGASDEGLDVRLLHVRPQEHLSAWPMLDQREARWVACVLEQGDAAAIWLHGLDGGDETANLALGCVRMLRKRTIPDEYDCSAHTHSE